MFAVSKRLSMASNKLLNLDTTNFGTSFSAWDSQTPWDTSLFNLKRKYGFVYLLIYVDDILVTGNSKEDIWTTLTLLADRFSVKGAEDLNYFLGIEAHRTDHGLHLSQRKYILELLHKYNMSNVKPVSTHMASSPKLSLTTWTSLSDPTKYRQLIGSLQYL